MHYARLDKSNRLQRLKRCLELAGGYISTLEIVKATNICAVNSAVSELRRNNLTIECQRKGEYFYYRLIP